jgi:predicted transcriptional regulator of viral defense system
MISLMCATSLTCYILSCHGFKGGTRSPNGQEGAEHSGRANWIAWVFPGYLRQAKDRGLVRQVGGGLYVADSSRVIEHHTLVEAAKRVPHGVICLLSALRFHGLTTQAPHEVWVAIAHKARRPGADYPPMRIVHFSAEALSYGVEEKKLEGSTVRVFGPAKTVANCFKYRK